MAAEYQHQWFHFEDDDHHTPSSSIGEESSMDSCVSSSDTKDDASSSYDLSEIMAQLPIKRGLSKFYDGKSESFASLSSVSSLEDLAKKPTILRRSRKNSMKASRSFGDVLNNCSKRYVIPPKGLISKKPPPSSSSSRARFNVSSSFSSKRVGFVDTKAPTC